MTSTTDIKITCQISHGNPRLYRDSVTSVMVIHLMDHNIDPPLLRIAKHRALSPRALSPRALSPRALSPRALRFLF